MRLPAFVAVTLALGILSSHSVTRQPAASASEPGTSPLRLLPLHFEENRGQAPATVKYLARAAGYDAFLTGGGAHIALRGPATNHSDPRVRGIGIRFVGSDATAGVDSSDPLPGRINYLRGNDPARWQVDVPTYRRVRYHEAYPGIDVVFYGNNQQLEYDFIVAPGANHRQVRLDVEGADRLQIDSEGNLLLHVGDRHIVQRRPVAYQLTANGREHVDARYTRHGATGIGFDIGAYDLALPLVIDPVLVYSTYFGGSSYDDILGVATDATGHVYIAGSTLSTDFPTTAGAYDTTADGSQDVYVAKLNPTGTALVYATVIGGTNLDHGYAVRVDAGGRAHVTGDTQSADFPATAGAVGGGCASGCGSDTFVVKLNAAGSALLYSARLSGTSNETGLDLALDEDGSAVVAGQTSSRDFPISADAYQPAKRGSEFLNDYFVTKLNASGSAIVYSTYLGGFAQEDNLVSVAIDSAGNAYVGGETPSADFPTRNARQATLRGDSDGFVSAFGPFGNLLFSTFHGGSARDGVVEIAVDADSAVYVTGATTSADFPLVAAADSTVAARDAFVTKFLPGGASLAYSTFIGGNNDDGGRGIAVDAAGNAHVTVYAGVDYPTTPDGAGSTEGGAFYTRLNATGGVTFSSYIGAAFPQDLAIDSAGNAYVGGQTLGLEMTIRNALQTTSPGIHTSGFLAKFGEWPAPLSPDDIVLYATNATTVAGGWRRETDPNAGGYERLHHPDAGAAKLANALASPVHYFDLSFTPQTGRAYRLWIRGRAERDHWSNDSVFVQFSHSVTETGVPAYRIGTTAATAVNLEDCASCGVARWGWQDNGYGAGVRGPAIYFGSNAPQTIRIQTREDGMMIDQIVLSPATWLNAAPGPLKHDTTVLRDDDGSAPTEPPANHDVVLHAGDAQLTGNWRLQPDTTAASGARVWNPNANLPKRTAALATPADHVELTFTAEAGRPYRLWIRGKAENNYWGNDSVFVQFSGSVNAGGAPVYRIGTTSATEYNLESCSGCGLSSWGWEDNGWGSGVLGPELYFTPGPQTIRLQIREDGLSFDQIILSPQRFLTTAPGPAKQDTTIYPKQP